MFFKITSCSHYFGHQTLLSEIVDLGRMLSNILSYLMLATETNKLQVSWPRYTASAVAAAAAATAVASTAAAVTTAATGYAASAVASVTTTTATSVTTAT